MALVRYNVAYQGMLVGYTSPTGFADIRTGIPQYGGGLNVGDFMDFTESEAQQISSILHEGRYRFVRVATAATAANIVQGTPVGLAKGTTVGQVALSAAGSGQTAGTYLINSTSAGGTSLAVAQVVVAAAGTISSATLVTPGAGFTSVPTFDLTAIGGSGGSVLAQMALTPNTVTSFDSSAVSLADVRGLFLGSLTAAQVTAGAYVFIQEQGIGTALVSTATNTAAGCYVAATTAGAVTSTTAATAVPVGFFGVTLDLAAAATLVRVSLRIAPHQG